MDGWNANIGRHKQERAEENQEGKGRMEVSEGVGVEVEASPLLL